MLGRLVAPADEDQFGIVALAGAELVGLGVAADAVLHLGAELLEELVEGAHAVLVLDAVAEDAGGMAAAGEGIFLLFFKSQAGSPERVPFPTVPSMGL